MSEILYESKDGVLTVGHYMNSKHNYYWININNFEKSGQIRLNERQFKLLKRWFKRKG